MIYVLVIMLGASLTAVPQPFGAREACEDAGRAWVQHDTRRDYQCLVLNLQMPYRRDR